MCFSKLNECIGIYFGTECKGKAVVEGVGLELDSKLCLIFVCLKTGLILMTLKAYLKKNSYFFFFILRCFKCGNIFKHVPVNIWP